MFFIVFYPLLGPGTSPIRFVSKTVALLEYLCVRSSDVVSELALGQFDVYVKKQWNLAGHQIFTNPEFESKPLFGAGYTKYQPELIFLNLFRAPKHVFVANQ